MGKVVDLDSNHLHVVIKLIIFPGVDFPRRTSFAVITFLYDASFGRSRVGQMDDSSIFLTEEVMGE
jgi:hypothetical protein